jgi:hypothetical protein
MAKPTSKPQAMVRKKSTPVSMPKKDMTRGTPAPMPKKTSVPGLKKATPRGPKKGLNDFLKEGKRPPSRNKKLPSDADVIIKGYNDKKTLGRKKK